MAATNTPESKKRTVCKICFNSSKDKPNPLLVPLVAETVTTASSAASKQKSECPRYRHDFIPVTVYQEPDTLKWESIREKVQINRMCQHKIEGKCRHGELCKYAHNDAEMALATPMKSRRQQKHSHREVPRIREAPLIRVCNKYKLCPYNIEGRCYFGRYCTFAHSEAELQTWNQQRYSTSVPAKKNSRHISHMNEATPKRGESGGV